MIRVGRLTSSDRASAGVYEDLSGPEIEQALASLFGTTALEWRRTICPDERPALAAALRDMIDRERCQLVVTNRRHRPQPARRHARSHP